MIKSDLDKLIKRHKVEPVGWGYIDCIISLDNVFDFINDLSDMGVKVSTLTWWCHCKGQSLVCPHGMGGPRSRYYDGWFSEMWFEMLDFENNEQVIAYLKNPKDKTMLQWFESRPKCLVPALWLDVPKNWRNEFQEEA